MEHHRELLKAELLLHGHQNNREQWERVQGGWERDHARSHKALQELQEASEQHSTQAKESAARLKNILDMVTIARNGCAKFEKVLRRMDSQAVSRAEQQAVEITQKLQLQQRGNDSHQRSLLATMTLNMTQNI